ncbi:hypothetical protein [Arabiibacter massiliensis]|uniref:hypothetical protein n=1 Tax=Arabiibacter massiliensis TaxID=1870985 RepID=UPI0009BB09B0|nr:hypothetical protein [Arabiibacter massiliensis]
MIRERLKSEAGETISEVLVGVLIVGLATVLFAAMIGVATNTSLTSVDRTTSTYGQLSAVDGTAPSGGATVSIAPVMGTGASVTGPTATFDVLMTTSTPSAADGTAYTFTRYLLPDFANASGGA